MEIKRRKTRKIKVGNVAIGGGASVSIQSMAKTKTSDISATIGQIKRLERAGCELVRVAVKDADDAAALGRIKKKIKIPLAADIHFDYTLALAAIKNGADKIRLNPGNIKRKEDIAQVIKLAKTRKIPVRIGVNSGSLPKGPSPSPCAMRMARVRGMIKAALDYIKFFEGLDFYDIVISLKASNVLATIGAYREMARLCDYPFHVGVTATGLKEDGAIKSAVGIGALLSEGIGDTIRVSLTADPVLEVEAAKSILQSLGLRSFGPEIISCPTCGRCQVDIEGIVGKLRDTLEGSRVKGQGSKEKPVSIAVMGCEVNGPGEAKEADIGIAAGKGVGVLFKRGRIVKRVREEDFVKEILKYIDINNR